MRYLYQFRKWAVWLSITGYLLCNAIYFHAWRIGLIKFACMQKTTDSMLAHMALISHPSLRLILDATFLIVGISLLAMIVDLRHGSLAWSKIRRFFALLSKKPDSILFTLVLLVGSWFYDRTTSCSFFGLFFFVLLFAMACFLLGLEETEQPKE